MSNEGDYIMYEFLLADLVSLIEGAQCQIR